MATIDDLSQRSLSDLTTEELMERMKELRSARRRASTVKNSRLSKKPPAKPKAEELTADMSIEAMERMIKALEDKLK